ncbi:MAG: hypothetical protein COB30_002500 [Ectothiorhodospiraceae bacterium]|nr:hypothetical protein [Ectothiorhodospiraceae bacterium]
MPMVQMKIEYLILCSANQEGTRIPSSLCYYYMVNYRINEKSIKALSEGAGLDYILSGENIKKYDIAKAFLERGLDVNGISHYHGMTPLQASVLGDDVQNDKKLGRKRPSFKNPIAPSLRDKT